MDLDGIIANDVFEHAMGDSDTDEAIRCDTVKGIHWGIFISISRQQLGYLKYALAIPAFVLECHPYHENYSQNRVEALLCRPRSTYTPTPSIFPFLDRPRLPLQSIDAQPETVLKRFWFKDSKPLQCLLLTCCSKRLSPSVHSVNAKSLPFTFLLECKPTRKALGAMDNQRADVVSWLAAAEF